MLSVPVTGARSLSWDLSCSSSGLPTLHTSIKSSSKAKGVAQQYRTAQNVQSQYLQRQLQASQGQGLGVDVQPRLWKGSSETNSTCFLGGALWDWSCSPCGTQLGNICLQTSFLPLSSSEPSLLLPEFNSQISRLLSKSQSQTQLQGKPKLSASSFFQLRTLQSFS